MRTRPNMSPCGHLEIIAFRFRISAQLVTREFVSVDLCRCNAARIQNSIKLASLVFWHAQASIVLMPGALSSFYPARVRWVVACLVTRIQKLNLLGVV
jgi:hypothetical protein